MFSQDCTATSSGNIETNINQTVWENNADNSNILFDDCCNLTIPNGITVNVQGTTTWGPNGNCSSVTITINGNLTFGGSHDLILPAGSTVNIANGSSISGGNGNSFFQIGATQAFGPFNYSNNSGGMIELNEGNLVSSLPIELNSFTGTYLDREKAIQLNWETQTETNNEVFEIEYSLDANIFFAIGSMAGAGTSYEPLQYSFLHRFLFLNIHSNEKFQKYNNI